MEDSLTPDFAAFEKPDMNYFRKRAEHPEETTAQDLLVQLQDARVYKHESKRQDQVARYPLLRHTHVCRRHDSTMSY